MSTIEFVLIPISIVVGLAIARILEGLHVVSESPNRYWVHTLWLLNKFGQVFIYIWAWRQGGVVGAVFGEAPTFGDLILSVCTPAIIFLQALALLGQAPSPSVDWKAHFYENRVRFFLLNAAMILVTGFGAFSFDNASGVLPYAALLTLNAVGLVTPNPRVHGAIACVAAFVVALGIGLPIVQSS